MPYRTNGLILAAAMLAGCAGNDGGSSVGDGAATNEPLANAKRVVFSVSGMS